MSINYFSFQVDNPELNFRHEQVSETFLSLNVQLIGTRPSELFFSVEISPK